MPDKIVWTPTVNLVFSTLKKALISFTVMKNPDPNQRFLVQTGASNVGVGAGLSQGEDGQPIAYFNEKLLDRVRNYLTTENEYMPCSGAGHQALDCDPVQSVGGRMNIMLLEIKKKRITLT